MSEIIMVLAGSVISAMLALAFSYLKSQRIIREKYTLEAGNQRLMEENRRLEEKIRYDQQEILQLNRECVHWEQNCRALQEKLGTEQKHLEEVQKRFETQFENLAHKILETNSEKLSRDNNSHMNQIIDPLKEKLRDFEEKIRVTHKENIEQQASLREQLLLIKDLGLQMSAEAKGLVQALKGDTKKQGNWGELILSRILESCGLEEGREYTLQGKGLAMKDEEGNRQMPDAIIHLPQQKHIIIDSKVSLTAYEEFINADGEENTKTSLRRHLDSIKKHIQGLGDRYYHVNEKLNSPDFVLMFLPIEASFSVAMQADMQMFEYAWSRKIVLVTPTTLLATLKTVSSIWKYEKQNANAMEIAKLGGLLYDQFVDFIGEMDKIKKGLDSAGGAYDEAMKRMVYNNTSLMKRAEKLRKLGVKNKKVIPADYLELPEETEDIFNEDVINIE